jgi:hypothetical protein
MPLEEERSLQPSSSGELPVEEASAWAWVLGSWNDEAVHKAYLARFADLEGLAQAGRRYREVLVRHPGDAVAIRFRDEVVKRATVQGLALLPRTPRRSVPDWLKRTLVLFFGFVAAGAAYKLFALFFLRRAGGLFP